MSAVSAPNPATISIREFARRDGCNEKLVRNAIRDGDLKRSPDGKLDATLVGSGWRLTNRRRADTPQPGCATRNQVSAVPAEAARLASQLPTPPLAESEAKKEHYLALLKQLEYEERIGQTIRVAVAEDTFGQVLMVIRSRFLRLPTRASEDLAGKTRNQAFAILTDHVHAILEEIAKTPVVVGKIEMTDA